jgi:hypothetical protein
MFVTAAGIVYIPVQLYNVKQKGKELESYALGQGISFEEAAVRLGYRKPTPKETE